MQAMQRVLGDPEVLLGAVRSPRADRARPGARCRSGRRARLHRLHGQRGRRPSHRRRHVASPRPCAGAVSRRAPRTCSIEKLLGLHVTSAQVRRGKLFVGGVVDRAGESALGALFTRAESLPTPAELDAPGLWLARLELD